MKIREESLSDSMRGEGSARQSASVLRQELTGSASLRLPARSVFPEMLIEAVVSRSNLVQAWEKVRTNGGAPGPDGVTVPEFLDWLTPRWEAIRAQLVNGTDRPSPVRRVTIPKPDGGERQLARNQRESGRTCWTVSSNRPSCRC